MVERSKMVMFSAYPGAMRFPPIVCLCGSTKFKEEFTRLNMELTLVGKVVVTVGAFMHADNLLLEPDKRTLDVLHLRKIDLADEVLFVNVRGYIDKSTARELAYTIYKKPFKKIVFLEPDLGEKFMQLNSHILGSLTADFANGLELPQINDLVIINAF